MTKPTDVYKKYKAIRIAEISVKNKSLDGIRIGLSSQISYAKGAERLKLIWQRNEISQQIQDNFDEYLTLLTYKSDQGLNNQ